MAFLLGLLHDVQRHLRPLLITQTRHQVVQQLQYPPARFLLSGYSSRTWSLANTPAPRPANWAAAPVPQCHQDGHNWQSPLSSPSDRVPDDVAHDPKPFHPPNLRATLVMGIGPIQTDHFPPRARDAHPR